MRSIRNIILTAAAAAVTACSGAPSNSNISSIGMPDKQSLPSPQTNGTNQYSANANNPQRNAVGESQATNTANAANNSQQMR